MFEDLLESLFPKEQPKQEEGRIEKGSPCGPLGSDRKIWDGYEKGRSSNDDKGSTGGDNQNPPDITDWTGPLRKDD